MSGRRFEASWSPPTQTDSCDSCPAGKMILALAAFLALAACLADAQCTSKPLPPSAPPTRLNVIFSDQLFSVVNRNDVIGAAKLWVEVISCLTRVNFNGKVEVIGSQSEIRRRVHDNAVDTLVLDDSDFLELSDAGLIDGVAVGSQDGHPYALSYLLLVNQQIDSLAQLRGKRAVYHLHTAAAASLAFATTLIAENHLGSTDTFFASFESSNQAANCVLSLFFEKIQACVVDERDWDTIKELNPQLGKKLKILAQSIPVLDGVVAFAKAGTPYRAQLVASLMEMHKDPLGNQILSALHSGQLLPYRPEYLDSTREFWKRYERTLTRVEQRAWRETRRPRTPAQVQKSAGAPSGFSAAGARD